MLVGVVPIYIVWEGGGVIYVKVFIGEVGEDVGCILGILQIYLVSMLRNFLSSFLMFGLEGLHGRVMQL